MGTNPNNVPRPTVEEAKAAILANLPAGEEKVRTAKAGMLHMLGVRYQQESAAGQDHLGMKDKNIDHWLTTPEPKAHLFDIALEHGNATMKNPYLSADVSIIQARKELMADGMIIKAAEIDKGGKRTMIDAERGLALTPFADQHAARRETPSERRDKASIPAMDELLNRESRIKTAMKRPASPDDGKKGRSA